MANAALQIQKLANQTQVQLQKLVNSANELQTKYNAQEAQKSRDWQTEMSKSAHQMEVEDLKKAGLNPVLSSGGSGAQSYTTSSASATPESGASALAALQGSQLGAIGSIESSRIAAAAQKAAAAQTAAAMKSAAAQSAAAAMYQANMGYKKAQLNAKVQEGINKTNIKIASINKGGTIPGAIEKALTKAGIYGPGLNAVKTKLVAPARSFLSKISSDPSKYFTNTGKITAGNFQLSSSGNKLANNLLNRYGLSNTSNNRRLVVKAYVFGNQNAVNSIMRTYGSHYKHSTKTTVRTGHR